MSLTATPVSLQDILNLQAGIEGFTNTAEATAEVATINAGTDTVNAYALRLMAANTAFSEDVMAVDSLMQNGVPTAGKLVSPPSPTANEFQLASTVFLPPQAAFATTGFSPPLNVVIYDTETYALAIGGGGDGTQNNFLKHFGSAALTVSQFETSLSGLTNVNVGPIGAQYQFFLKLYSTPGNLPGGIPTLMRRRALPRSALRLAPIWPTLRSIRR